MSLFLTVSSDALTFILVLIVGALAFLLLRKIFISRALMENREKSMEMLRQLSWLSGLSEKEFKQVAKRFRIKIFRQGTKLLKEQETDNGLFMIVAGNVRIGFHKALTRIEHG